jgi:hypothetical protein
MRSSFFNIYTGIAILLRFDNLLPSLQLALKSKFMAWRLLPPSCVSIHSEDAMPTELKKKNSETALYDLADRSLELMSLLQRSNYKIVEGVFGDHETTLIFEEREPSNGKYCWEIKLILKDNRWRLETEKYSKETTAVPA